MTKFDHKIETTWHIHKNFKTHKHPHNDEKHPMHFDFIKLINPFHDVKKEDQNKIKDFGHESAIVWKLVLGIIAFIISITFTFYTITPTINLWILFTTATLSIFTIGIEYFISLYYSIKYLRMDDDILVVISILFSYIYSCVMAFWFGNLDYELFEIVGEILGLMYVGKFLEGRLSENATKEIELLSEMFSDKAIKLENNKEVEIDPKTLVIGDKVIVKMGSKIPIDGVIFEGQTATDDSAFTGESIPITKRKNDRVFCGTIASSGTIKLVVTETLDNSTIGTIIKNINNVTASKPRTQRIADRIAKWFIPMILLTTFIVVLSWGLTSQDWNKAFNVAITLLVTACPSSFALVTPLAVLFSMSFATKKGIHFNTQQIFEKSKKINTICFDKTGTLTEGILSFFKSTIPKDLMNLVVYAEKQSNHPIAKAIVKKFENIDLSFNEKNTSIKEISGRGFEIQWENQKYYLGSKNFLKSYLGNFEVSETNQLLEQGKIIIYLGNEKKICGYIVLEDKIKSSAKTVIANFIKNKIDVFMITGDNKLTAKYVASELEISETNIFSEVLPTQKQDIIKKLKSEGRIVAFVGDGINDSIALKEADISISMGTGTDIAKESSDIVIQRNDLNLILDALYLTKKTLHTIYRGFVYAFGFNFLVIPLSISGVLPPLVAIIIHLISDLSIVVNALFVKRNKKD